MGLRTIDDVYKRGLGFTYGTFYPNVMKYIKSHCCDRGNSLEIQALKTLEHYYKVYIINFEPHFIIREHERLGGLTQDDKTLLQEFMQSEGLEDYIAVGGEYAKYEVSNLNQKRYLANAVTRHKKALKHGNTSNRHKESYIVTAEKINDVCHNYATKEYFTMGTLYRVRKEKILTKFA